MKTLTIIMIALLCSTTQLLSQENGKDIGSQPSDRSNQSSVVYDKSMMGIIDIEHREFLLNHIPEGCELMAMRLVIADIDWRSLHMADMKLLCKDLSELTSKRFREFYLLARMTGEDPLKQILPRHSVYFASVSSSAGCRRGFASGVPLLDALFQTAVSLSYVLFYETVRANSASLADRSLPPGAPGMYRHSGDIAQVVRDRGDIQALDVHRRMEADKRISR